MSGNLDGFAPVGTRMRAALFVLVFAGTAAADDTTIFDLDPKLQLPTGPLVTPSARPSRLPWGPDTRSASERARQLATAAPPIDSPFVAAPVFAPTIWCGNTRELSRLAR